MYVHYYLWIQVRRRDPKIIGCMAWRPGYYRYTTWSSNWENLEPRQKSLYMDWAAIIMDAVNDWGINCLYWWFVGLSAILFQKDSITRLIIYFFNHFHVLICCTIFLYAERKRIGGWRGTYGFMHGQLIRHWKNFTLSKMFSSATSRTVLTVVR